MKDGDMRHNTFMLWEVFRINKDDGFKLAVVELSPVHGDIVRWKLKQLVHVKGGHW